MKILYVDLKFDYGIASRGLNQIGEIGFHQVFKTLGHTVVPFYYDNFIIGSKTVKNQLKANLQLELLKIADDEMPDLIFFSLYTDQFLKETLNYLKNKFTTMNWFGDDQWRFESFTTQYANCFTYSITTDPFAVPKYKKIGYENVILSQWAALNIETTIDEQKYKYDVSFVGGCHSVRRWIVNEFRKNNITVHTFGFGWPMGSISLTEMQSVFAQSKVNLNLSNSVTWDLRYLIDSWKNPFVRVKSKKNVSQMKARNFEIPYFSGFQLAEYFPSIEGDFDIGKNIACYSTVDEAIFLTKYYIENDSIRESIKQESIKHVRAQHTYLHRFKKIFAEIGI